jgi:hypothetical protein
MLHNPTVFPFPIFDHRPEPSLLTPLPSQRTSQIRPSHLFAHILPNNPSDATSRISMTLPTKIQSQLVSTILHPETLPTVSPPTPFTLKFISRTVHLYYYGLLSTFITTWSSLPLLSSFHLPNPTPSLLTLISQSPTHGSLAHLADGGKAGPCPHGGSMLLSSLRTRSVFLPVF